MRKLAGIISILLAASSLDALAQDSEVDPDIALLEKQIKVSEARKAASDAKAAEYEAETAAQKSRFSFIPQSGAEGKVTLGEGAGGTEAAMLSTLAIQAVGTKIYALATPPTGTLLLSGDDALNVSAFSAFNAEAAGIEAEFSNALAANMPAACTGSSGTVGPEIAPVAIGSAISAVAGMLRTDTEIKGVAVDLDSALLAKAVSSAALAANPANILVMPSARVAPVIDGTNEVVLKLCRLDKARVAAQAAIPAKPTDDQKATASALIAAVARYDGFYTALTKPDDKGNVRLATILDQSTLIGSNAKVLRVRLDKAGGSLLTRRNLWTALGAQAVAISGGLVASFTVSDPRTGQVSKAGTVVCSTDLTGLRRVQSLSKLRKPQCIS